MLDIYYFSVSIVIMKYDIKDKNKYHWKVTYRRHDGSKGYSTMGILKPVDAISYLNKMRDTYQYSHIKLNVYDAVEDTYYTLANYSKLPDLRDWADLMAEQKYEAAKDSFLYNPKEYEGMSVEDVENTNPHIF